MAARPHNPDSRLILIRILDRRGWSYSELARRAKVSRPIVSLHLSGRRPIKERHMRRYLQVLLAAAGLVGCDDGRTIEEFRQAWLKENGISKIHTNA